MVQFLLLLYLYFYYYLHLHVEIETEFAESNSVRTNSNKIQMKKMMECTKLKSQIELQRAILCGSQSGMPFWAWHFCRTKTLLTLAQSALFRTNEFFSLSGIIESYQ